MSDTSSTIQINGISRPALTSDNLEPVSAKTAAAVTALTAPGAMSNRSRAGVAIEASDSIDTDSD